MLSIYLLSFFEFYTFPYNSHRGVTPEIYSIEFSFCYIYVWFNKMLTNNLLLVSLTGTLEASYISLFQIDLSPFTVLFLKDTGVKTMSA